VSWTKEGDFHDSCVAALPGLIVQTVDCTFASARAINELMFSAFKINYIICNNDISECFNS